MSGKSFVSNNEVASHAVKDACGQLASIPKQDWGGRFFLSEIGVMGYFF